MATETIEINDPDNEFEDEEDVDDETFNLSWKLSRKSYEFINYLSSLSLQPSEEDLIKIKIGGKTLQKLMDTPEAGYWGNNRIGNLHQLVEICNTRYPSYTRNFVTDFIAENLSVLEVMFDKPGYIIGEDPTIPDIPGRAVLVESASCLILSGNPEYRSRAYQFLSRHKSEFAESLIAPLGVNTKILDNLLADPMAPHNPDEEEFANVADFVRKFPPLSDPIFGTDWQDTYPVWMIYPNIAQYLKGEIDQTKLQEIAEKYLKFSELKISLGEIFKEDGDYVSREAQQLVRSWIEQFLSGGISEVELNTLRINLYQLGGAVRKLRYEKEREDKKREFDTFRHGLQEYLVSIDPGTLPDLEPVTGLVKKGILPTPTLVDYVKNNRKIAFAEIGRLKKEIKQGKFDVNNPIQRDLEFPKYFHSSVPQTNNYVKSYNEFQRLSFITGAGLNLEYLFETEDRETQAAAFEAALLYKFIYDRTLDGRKTVLFGNRRYGADIVVEPLKPYFRDLWVDTRYCYFHSSASTKEIEFKAIADCLILEEPEQIIIVDGTRNIGEKVRRFPNSFAEIADLLTILQEDPMVRRRYELTFWSPEPTPEIQIGNSKELITYTPPGEEPTVIFAIPVLPRKSDKLPGGVKNHEPGFFDDIESDSINLSQAVFDKNGLRILTATEIQKFYEEVIPKISDHRLERVQDKITAALPGMIELVMAS